MLPAREGRNKLPVPVLPLAAKDALNTTLRLFHRTGICYQSRWIGK